MLFLWIIAAGLIAGGIATVLMPERPKGGLFVLGAGGAIIAAAMQYAEAQPVNLVGSAIGAAIMLVLYRVTSVKTVKERAAQATDKDEFRKAA